MRFSHSCVAALAIVQAQRDVILILKKGQWPAGNKSSVKMAHIAENIGAQALASQGRGFVSRLADALARRRVYRQTYTELSALSTRELADLGITRSMISRLAYEAAYGKN
jgi:uncharacterized protein YjiS (DUF1127 family)